MLIDDTYRVQLPEISKVKAGIPGDVCHRRVALEALHPMVANVAPSHRPLHAGHAVVNLNLARLSAREAKQNT